MVTVAAFVHLEPLDKNLQHAHIRNIAYTELITVFTIRAARDMMKNVH